MPSSAAEAQFTAAVQRVTNAIANMQAALAELVVAHDALKAEQSEMGQAVKQIVERVRPEP